MTASHTNPFAVSEQIQDLFHGPFPSGLGHFVRELSIWTREVATNTNEAV